MGNGTIQWLWQRFSALILLAYTIYLARFLLMHPEIDYGILVSFFSNYVTRLFTSLALIALAMHTWIGMWSITTDYLTERALGTTRANGLRLFVQMLILLLLFGYLGVGMATLWLSNI